METDTLEIPAAALDARELMSPAGETVRADTTVWEVVERFLTGPARHVVVVDGDRHCIGIVCTRHFSNLWPLDPARLKEATVESLGLGGWITLSPDDDLRTCARTLTEYQLDAAPVVDGEGRVLGVVTACDLARALADAPVPRRLSRQR